MDFSSRGPNGRIEEYNALRAEIVTIITRRTQRLAITWTGLAALLVASFTAKIPELAVLSMLLVCSAWKDELVQMLAIHKIGSYIRCFIEPVVDGVQWETVNISTIQVRSDWKARFKLTVNSSYGAAALISIVSSVYSVLAFPPDDWKRLIAFCLLFVFTLFLMKGVVCIGMDMQNERQKCMKRFHKRAKEEFGIESELPKLLVK